MDYLIQEEIKILYKLNNQKEEKVGPYLVYGSCINIKTVYGFNGYYFHFYKYNCFIIKHSGQVMVEKLEKVQEKDERKRLLHISLYKVVSFQKCQFINNIKHKCPRIYDNYLPFYNRRNKSGLTMDKTIRDIQKKGAYLGLLRLIFR